MTMMFSVIIFLPSIDARSYADLIVRQRKWSYGHIFWYKMLSSADLNLGLLRSNIACRSSHILEPSSVDLSFHDRCSRRSSRFSNRQCSENHIRIFIDDSPIMNPRNSNPCFHISYAHDQSSMLVLICSLCGIKFHHPCIRVVHEDIIVSCPLQFIRDVNLNGCPYSVNHRDK